RYQVGHDVEADVAVDPEFHLPHPVEVSTGRVEHGADTELAKEHRQIAADCGRLDKIRTLPRYRYASLETVVAVDFGEGTLNGPERLGELPDASDETRGAGIALAERGFGLLESGQEYLRSSPRRGGLSGRARRRLPYGLPLARSTRPWLPANPRTAS